MGQTASLKGWGGLASQGMGLHNVQISKKVGLFNTGRFDSMFTSADESRRFFAFRCFS